MSAVIRQMTIVEQVMERMKELIASGQYKPGDQLPPEGDLARDWGVSRSSIREAVKIFNYLGLLESHAGRGTFLCQRTHISSSALSLIALLGSNESNQIVDMRFSLELWCALDLAAAYAARIPGAYTSVEHMEAFVGKMRLAATASDLVELDMAFHEELIRSQHNELFTDIFTTLRSFSYNLDSIVHKNISDTSEITDTHRQLLGYIRDNDTIRLVQAVKAHNSRTLEMYQLQ